MVISPSYQHLQTRVIKKCKAEGKRVWDIYTDYLIHHITSSALSCAKNPIYHITNHSDTLIATPVYLKSTEGVYGTTLLDCMIIKDHIIT